MERDTIEKIVELAENRIDYINGQTYSEKKLYLVQEPTAAEIKVQTLTGLIDYLKSNFDEGTDSLMVHIVSPTKVVVFAPLNSDRGREQLIVANAFTPSMHYENFYHAEEFNIKLQSVFVPNEDRDILLKVVGNIKEEQVNTIGDDGVSQSVTAKVGVGTVAEVKVPNPVTLAPRRTFVEVPQPESNFVFRMRTGAKCALFESDGGAWQIDAMQNVKDYLETSLTELIEQKKVYIIG